MTLGRDSSFFPWTAALIDYHPLQDTLSLIKGHESQSCAWYCYLPHLVLIQNAPNHLTPALLLALYFEFTE